MIAGVLALLVVASLAGVVRGGPLDPAGPPGSTTSVTEPRVPISSLPFTITQPGSYFLTRDLVYAGGGGGITIQANDVTLDLNGFRLAGTTSGSSGITEGASSPSRTGWTIRNGTIEGWGYNAIWSPDVNASHFENLTFISNGSTTQIPAVLAGSATVANHLMFRSNARGELSLGVFARVTDIIVDPTNLDAQGFGIIVGDQSVVDGCQIVGPSTGVFAGFNSEVAHCSFRFTYHGVDVRGSSNVHDNSFDFQDDCGVIVHDAGDTISDNKFTSSGGGVCGSGVAVTIEAFRNSFAGVPLRFTFGVSGQAIEQPSSTATSPFANTYY
jgi:hypothetical protein